MGWILNKAWHLTLFCALLAALGSTALMLAFVRTAGNAVGQGTVGTREFVTSVSNGYAEADAYQQAVDAAAARKEAAKEKARRKAQQDAGGN